MNDKPDHVEKSPFFLMLESSGMKFLNQLKKHGFSLNTLQMNALDLMEATLKVHDPDHGPLR
jgi:hypothetical protein